ncbi:MAG: hypothetical protein JNJ99_14770 [Crocinitomicaceae bacterium]|nr:hypothetical protein [Crocinitomicaceae bacterium]
MKYHPGLLLLITAIAAGMTFFLYYRERLLEEVRKELKWMMAIFRFITLWVILFLLTGIIVENLEERKEEPLIILAHDNSESVIMNKDSDFYRNEYADLLENLSMSLKEDYEVIDYSFTDVSEKGLLHNYSGKVTDISQLFTQIFDQYGNRNIGAIILSSDGIYNAGSNPVYAVNEKSFVPVYTIGLGDTTPVRDLKIDAVNHNDVAFLGNEFPVEVVFTGVKATDENAVISVYQGKNLVGKQQIQFDSDFQQSKNLFMLRATGTGLQQYTAKISTIDNEFSVKNNEMNFYIEVIDGRQKILLAHQSPHPDVAAVRFVIENNKNYQAEVKYFKEITSVTEYDLVIVHSYQSGNSVLDEAIKTGSVPILLINGTSTDIRNLQNLQVGFSGNGNSTEETGFVYNVAFKDILLSPKIVSTISSAPPLHAPFGSLNYSKAIDILAFQKVGTIQLDNPLIYFTQKEKSRLGVIMGEGIWRWRLHDQLRNNSTLIFEEFLSKLITYLAVKENKDPFRVKIENEYNENEEVMVEAELYNKSFELINESQVSFSYADQNANTFNSVFMPVGKNYRLNLGKLKSGIYSWEAKTVFQQNTYVKKGTFLVKEIRLEWLNTVADHRLLRNLSQNTGGQFYFPNQLNELEQHVRSNKDLATVVYQEKSFDDLIDFKWLFFLIMLFISAEWFFRKYNGAY